MKKDFKETGSSTGRVSADANSPFRGSGGKGSGGMGIAIQGYAGSFHQVAAQVFFGKEVPVIACDTFRDVVKIASNKHKSDGAVMAIENSIAGSILANYNLLQQSDLTVVGEVYLQIRQNLLVNRGVQLDDIREVHSHTMALQQCYGFLDKHKWKLVETEDTALSAKHIRQHRSKHIAAIASKLAAELYDLDVLAPNIQTLKNNYTRFLVLKRTEEKQPAPLADKASVYFHTDHSRGSLARVLGEIADGGINLSKLQSFPIPGSEFKYSFHADMEFNDLEQFYKVIERMRNMTAELRIYGVYRRGVWM